MTRKRRRSLVAPLLTTLPDPAAVSPTLRMAQQLSQAIEPPGLNPTLRVFSQLQEIHKPTGLNPTLDAFERLQNGLLPPPLRQLQQLQDRLTPPWLRMHESALRVTEVVNPILRAIDNLTLPPVATAFLQIAPLFDRAAQIVGELDELDADEDLVSKAWRAYRENRLGWLMGFTEHALLLDRDLVGDVIEVLREQRWRTSRDPRAYVAGAAKRRHRQRQQRRENTLLPEGHSWLDVEHELISNPRHGQLDTAMGQALAQLDLRKVLLRKLTDEEAWFAVLVVHGYTEAEICERLEIPLKRLWAIRQGLRRRDIVLATRRSPTRPKS